MLYRDEVYNEDTPNKGLAEIIMPKVRKGMVGSVVLESQFQYCRFSETDREAEEQQDYSKGIGF